MFAICLQTKKFENKIVEKPCKIRKSLCKHFCKQYKVGIRANFFIYSNVNGGEIIMADVTVQKRGEVYQYKFEITSIDGKRKFKNKSGFATKSEAKQAGIIAYNEYLNTGHSFKFLPQSIFDNMAFNKKDTFILGKSMKKLDFSNKVQKIKCPTLTVCGEKDSANIKSAYYLSENIKNAKLKIIENTGHVVNEEKPQILAKVLEQFYKEF
jgi:possible acyl-coA thioester hydrolase